MNKSIRIVGVTVTLALLTGTLGRWLEQSSPNQPVQALSFETPMKAQQESVDFEAVALIAQASGFTRSLEVAILDVNERLEQPQIAAPDPYAVGPIEQPEFVSSALSKDSEQHQTIESRDAVPLDAWEQRYSDDASGMHWNPLESRFEKIYNENQLYDSVVTYVNCRTQWCRMEAYHLDRGKEEAFIAAFVAQPEVHIGNKTALYHREEDAQGSVRSLYFWSNTRH